MSDILFLLDPLFLALSSSSFSESTSCCICFFSAFCLHWCLSSDKVRKQCAQVDSIKMQKFRTFKDFCTQYEEQSGVPISRQIWWAWRKRRNGTYRPMSLLTKEDDDKYLCDLVDGAVKQGAEPEACYLDLYLMVSSLVLCLCIQTTA